MPKPYLVTEVSCEEGHGPRLVDEVAEVERERWPPRRAGIPRDVPPLGVAPPLLGCFPPFHRAHYTTKRLGYCRARVLSEKEGPGGHPLAPFRKI